MSAVIARALNEAAISIDHVRNDVVFADPRSISANSLVRDRSIRISASSYIWLSSIFEKFLKDSLVGLIDELHRLSIPKDRLKVSLLVLSCAGDFDALQDTRGLKNLKKRMLTLATVSSTDPATFNSAMLPLDGRTIRAEHLETLWGVFGFQGIWLPDPRHQFALNDLADNRNNLAHGEVDPLVLGRRKTYAELLRLIDLIEEVIIHVGVAFLEYLAKQHYFR